MKRILGIVLAGFFALLGIAAAAQVVSAPYANFISSPSSNGQGLQFQHEQPLSPSPAALDSRCYQQALLRAIGKISRLKLDVTGTAVGALVQYSRLDRFRGLGGSSCSSYGSACRSALRLHLLHCILRT